MSEDNPLANVDLHLIAAPRAPAGFADGVLSRFASTEAAIAVAKRQRARRLAWIASGAVAAAAAVVAVLWLWPRGPETGAYATAEPYHLDVAGLAVELDRGASISWTVRPGGLDVDQRGRATWTVPAGQHLHVEVAGVGAVDATNATLRVETQMNLMDGKMIGATAATAALVTAVTLTVTHGQATVSGAGKELAIKGGQSASVSRGKEPLELITAGDPTAVEIVFCGNAAWTARELELMESAIDHVLLPEGSTIGAVSYATGATLRAEATPKVRFGAGFLGYVPLYKDATGSDLVQGMTMGLSELRKANAPRKTLVVVGDGNDTNSEAATGMLQELHAEAEEQGIEIRAVLAPGKAATPSPIERAGIQTFDADPVDLTRALALAMGGTVHPPSVVEVVYEGRGGWMNADVLRAIGNGMSDIDLAPGSRIGAISYSAGAGTVIPLEPLASFKPAQLGVAKGYAANTGSDLVVGVTMGLQILAEAPEPDKVLIVIGDGHDTRDETAAAKMDELREQAKQIHVRVRALQYGSLDTLPGHLLKHLDPHTSEFGGKGYEGRLQGLQMALTIAPETIPARGGHAFDSAE